MKTRASKIQKREQAGQQGSAQASACAVAKILNERADSLQKTAETLRYDQPPGVRHALDVHVNLLRDLAMELEHPGQTKYAPLPSSK